MELYLDHGLNVRFRAWMWRKLWPLFQHFVFGGIRQPVRWALQASSSTPLVQFKRSCFELDLAHITIAIGLVLAGLFLLLLFKCLPSTV